MQANSKSWAPQVLLLMSLGNKFAQAGQKQPKAEEMEADC